MANDKINQSLSQFDRAGLAQALSLIESEGPLYEKKALALLEKILPQQKSDTLRLGITGTPGVGKSSFIERLGLYITREQQQSLAVLAIDPASSRTGGSILGDKTRMEELSREEKVFIRPLSNQGELGGIHSKIYSYISLFEAAQFDVVCVESVGVGQAEFMMRDVVDIMILLVAPGGGDGLQGIKRGLLECIDLMVVNKADGDFLSSALQTCSEYQAALRITRADIPPVMMVSSLSGQEEKAEKAAFSKIWQQIKELQKRGEWKKRREEQRVIWMQHMLTQELMKQFSKNKSLQREKEKWKKLIRNGEVTPMKAARELAKNFFKKSS